MTVEEIDGRRGRISSPNKGWIPLRSKNGRIKVSSLSIQDNKTTDIGSSGNSKKSNERESETEEKPTCFIDGLFKELIKHQIDALSVNKFRSMITDELYDSDAFQEDLAMNSDENEASNIKNYIDSCIENKHSAELMKKICEQTLTLKDDLENQYSSSFRFFYWTFYKNNTDSHNKVFGRGVIEKNDGYLLKDWFIAPFHSSFKEEILNNKRAQFALDDWIETMEKAIIKYQSWLKDINSRPLTCHSVDGASYNFWERLYGIPRGSPITIPHLMALLFYTNYSSQSYEFSASFRRIFYNESDGALKKRHSRFANWARLLRETVECYGTKMSQSPVSTYYHGIGQEMLFQGTYFKIYGPLSTTAGLVFVFCSYFYGIHCFCVFVWFYGLQSLKLLMVHLRRRREWLLIL